jgi:hypothetical protein
VQDGFEIGGRYLIHGGGSVGLNFR